MRGPHPRDDTDVAQDTARDLAEISAHIAQQEADANAYLTRPELLHSAAEARERSRSCRGGSGGSEEEGAP